MDWDGITSEYQNGNRCLLSSPRRSSSSCYLYEHFLLFQSKKRAVDDASLEWVVTHLNNQFQMGFSTFKQPVTKFVKNKMWFCGIETVQSSDIGFFFYSKVYHAKQLGNHRPCEFQYVRARAHYDFHCALTILYNALFTFCNFILLRSFKGNVLSPTDAS